MNVQILDSSIADVLTPLETAKILHIGRSTMYRLLAEGSIRSFRIGTKILVPKSFLQDFIAKSSAIDYDSNIQMVDNLSCCEKEENV